jgi:centrosomal protein CEP112
MNKVEGDLQRSKSLREKQAKDFQKQFDEIQNDHRNKIENLKNDFENEKLKLKRQYEFEKQALRKESSDACNEMQEQFQNQIMEKNEQNRLKMEKLGIVSSLTDLKGQLILCFFNIFRPLMI